MRPGATSLAPMVLPMLDDHLDCAPIRGAPLKGLSMLRNEPPVLLNLPVGLFGLVGLAGKRAPTGSSEHQTLNVC